MTLRSMRGENEVALRLSGFGECMAGNETSSGLEDKLFIVLKYGYSHPRVNLPYAQHF